MDGSINKRTDTNKQIDSQSDRGQTYKWTDRQAAILKNTQINGQIDRLPDERTHKYLDRLPDARIHK
jgi:hypothetical protein